MYRNQIVKLHAVSELFEECVIVDLGGTLAHRGERPKESFHERFLEDGIDEKMRDLVNLLYASNVMIIILTGQWDTSRAITQEWLRIHNVKHHNLFMKMGNLDKRDTLDFKEWFYTKIIKDLIPVNFVLEDREEIVEMWRNLHVK